MSARVRCNLIDARWPNGFRRPSCGYDKGWQPSGKAFTRKRAGCGKQTSVTAGTLMHGSKPPRTVWFWAAHPGASEAMHSKGLAVLQKQLGSARTRRPGTRRQAVPGSVAPHRSPLAGLVSRSTRPCSRTAPRPIRQARAWRPGQDAGRRRCRSVRRRAWVRPTPIADLSAASLRTFRRHRENPRLVQLHRRPSITQTRTSSCRGCIVSSPTSNLGARRPSRGVREAPAILSRRLRLPFQSPPYQTHHLPLPAASPSSSNRSPATG